MRGDFNLTAEQQKQEQAERLLKLQERRERIARRISDAVLDGNLWRVITENESADAYLKRIGLEDII